MPVAASDLVFYAAQNMPTDDAGLVGGDIDTQLRALFADISNASLIQLVSDNPADNMSVTVTGRLSNGVVNTESVALNGTTPVTTTNQYNSIFLIQLSSAAAGNVTVTGSVGPVTVGVIPPGELGYRRAFYDVTAPGASGSPVARYEKIFLKNNNTSSGLINGQVQEVSGVGQYLKVDFALETAFGNTQTVANRLTAPTSNVTAFGGGPINLPGNMLPGQYVGVWLRLLLNPGDAAADDIYRLTVSGETS